MKSLIGIIVFFLLFNPLAIAADGCLVGNTLYTARATGSIHVDLLANGMNVFKDVPPISTNNCISGSIVGTCEVCHGNPSVGLNIVGIKILVCTSGLNLFAQVDSGIYYSSYVLECDLDSFSLSFTVIAGAFGLIIIRRKSKH